MKDEQFLRWGHLTHTMRYHAHYHTAGEGGHVLARPIQEVFPFRIDSHFHVLLPVRRTQLTGVPSLVERAEDWRWRVSVPFGFQPSEPFATTVVPHGVGPFGQNWVSPVVNEELDDKELDAVRCRSGVAVRSQRRKIVVESIARRLDLESTLRARAPEKKTMSGDQRKKELSRRDGCLPSRPPHRSVLNVLPHTAPSLGSNDRIRMCGATCRVSRGRSE